MVALGLLFVGTTLLLFVMQAAESFDAGLRATRSPQDFAELEVLRAIGRTQLALGAVE